MLDDPRDAWVFPPPLPGYMTPPSEATRLDLLARLDAMICDLEQHYPARAYMQVLRLREVYQDAFALILFYEEMFVPSTTVYPYCLRLDALVPRAT